MTITLEQAQEILATIGVDAPEFEVIAWVAIVNSIQECLDKHYPPEVAMALLAALLRLYGVSAGGGMYVSSQTAPSGASQSFRFESPSVRYTQLRGMLTLLDKHGCAHGLIPESPDAVSAFIMVGKGGCMR